MPVSSVEVFTDMDMAALGQRLHRARLAKGLSQDQLAWRAEMTPNHYGLVERGKAKGLRVHALHALCHVLGVSADYLMGISLPDPGAGLAPTELTGRP